MENEADLHGVRRGPNETELMFWKFPADLKSDFKKICALKEVTMKDTVIGLMREYVNRRRSMLNRAE